MSEEQPMSATTNIRDTGRQSGNTSQLETGRRRVIIEGVSPEIDGGRFPIKRIAGEQVVVEADVFTDGHDAISCVLLYRQDSDPDWSAAPMVALVNDRWRGAFPVAQLGR